MEHKALPKIDITPLGIARELRRAAFVLTVNCKNDAPCDSCRIEGERWEFMADAIEKSVAEAPADAR